METNIIIKKQTLSFTNMFKTKKPKNLNKKVLVSLSLIKINKEKNITSST